MKTKPTQGNLQKLHVFMYITVSTDHLECGGC